MPSGKDETQIAESLKQNIKY